ncbi:MAG: hypothetical protein ACREQQ_04130 [Candidatus Binatia bacterium]
MKVLLSAAAMLALTACSSQPDLEGRTVPALGTVIEQTTTETLEHAVPPSSAAPEPPMVTPPATAPSPAPLAPPGAPGPATLAVPPEVAAKRTALEKLRELKRLNDEGRLGDQDYEAIRQKVIEAEVGPQR